MKDHLLSIEKISIRPLLFEGWITLSNGEIAIQRRSVNKAHCAIHWIEVYPVNSVIFPSNNQGQVSSKVCFVHTHLLKKSIYIWVVLRADNAIQPINCLSVGKCHQNLLCYPWDRDLLWIELSTLWIARFWVERSNVKVQPSNLILEHNTLTQLGLKW